MGRSRPRSCREAPTRWLLPRILDTPFRLHLVCWWQPAAPGSHSRLSNPVRCERAGTAKGGYYKRGLLSPSPLVVTAFSHLRPRLSNPACHERALPVRYGREASQRIQQAVQPPAAWPQKSMGGRCLTERGRHSPPSHDSANNCQGTRGPNSNYWSPRAPRARLRLWPVRPHR